MDNHKIEFVESLNEIGQKFSRLDPREQSTGFIVETTRDGVHLLLRRSIGENKETQVSVVDINSINPDKEVGVFRDANFNYQGREMVPFGSHWYRHIEKSHRGLGLGKLMEELRVMFCGVLENEYTERPDSAIFHVKVGGRFPSSKIIACGHKGKIEVKIDKKERIDIARKLASNIHLGICPKFSSVIVMKHNPEEAKKFWNIIEEETRFELAS